MRMEKSIKINCAPERAFAFATDFNNAPQWVSGFAEAKILSEGEFGVGSTYLFSLQILGQKIDLKSEIVVYEPPTRYEYKDLSSPFPIVGGFSFQAEDGGTLATLFGEGNPGGFFKMAGGLLQIQLSNQLDATLQALKRALEN